MSRDREYWRDFWDAKDNPLHSSSDPAYYDRLAAELCLLLPKKFASLLDIGCGSGALYERMGMHKINYVGIDFSTQMIAKFKSDFPAADVRVCDVRDFVGQQKFDVIFSHGVMQNLNPKEFENLIGTSLELLNPGGSMIHAGILWDRGRYVVESGMLQEHPQPFYKRLANAILTRANLRPSMGHWYSMRKVRQQARARGLLAQFYGSLLYPYRFHVVLTRVTK